MVTAYSLSLGSPPIKNCPGGGTWIRTKIVPFGEEKSAVDLCPRINFNGFSDSGSAALPGNPYILKINVDSRQKQWHCFWPTELCPPCARLCFLRLFVFCARSAPLAELRVFQFSFCLLDVFPRPVGEAFALGALHSQKIIL